ncbi:2-oxoglutarate dehydrogenase E1 subunit family protein, partial [Rhodococcus daqingensis]
MSSSSTSQFGQNQWLVDEMYQRFQKDPASVDASWHEFLTDYTPDASGAGNGVSTPTVPAAPAPTNGTAAPATNG